MAGENKMKIYGFAALLALIAAGTAQAQATCQWIGSQRFCNSPYGSSTTQQIGNQSFTTFSNGGSATSQRVGNQAFTNFSNGTSSTTQRVGNTTITRYSDGRTVTCQWVGSQQICN
jgi:hypothetical protein